MSKKGNWSPWGQPWRPSRTMTRCVGCAPILLRRGAAFAPQKPKQCNHSRSPSSTMVQAAFVYKRLTEILPLVLRPPTRGRTKICGLAGVGHWTRRGNLDFTYDWHKNQRKTFKHCWSGCSLMEKLPSPHSRHNPPFWLINPNDKLRPNFPIWSNSCGWFYWCGIP